MLESELQRKKELVARICVALKRRQEKMIKARIRFKHMARSLYWSVIWPSITSRYTHWSVICSHALKDTLSFSKLNSLSGYTSIGSC
jgi:hypothetical protein